MNNLGRVSIVVSLCMLSAAPSPLRAGTLGPRLARALSGSAPSAVHLVWVACTDKGPQKLAKAAGASTLVTPQSLRRRANVLPEGLLLDETDLPVNDSYVARIAATGALLRNRSKWLNAVSVRATAGQIQAIAVLPFVREVELVGRYRRSPTPSPLRNPPGAPALLPRTSGAHSLNYGPSVNQVTLINVPSLHDLGNYAQGVIVGVFDNGFRLLNHEAFASLNVIATYDFVDHKVSVVPGNPSTSFGDHGVNTLSAIGGYKPGQLIGPAFGASYILARTENDSSETPLEEDNWVRAIEWADSLGVQVTSTSLGYLDYDPGYTSWTWRDMDGRTTAISRAAAMAVRKGILVVNSAGNEGFNASHNTLLAPADADSVVAVGAADLSGNRASFSSVGPSTATPPRIKPDLMAPGVTVWVASETNPAGYRTAQGTSFACPLAAGAAALLVKAFPTASPMQIVDAMKRTAGKASAPDNLMGWGIINASAAYALLSGTDTNPPPATPTQYLLQQNYPNPFNPGTDIVYALPATSQIALRVYDLLGREVRTLASGELAAGVYTAHWNGTDGRGVPVASGTYIYRLTATGPGAVRTERTRMMVLLR